MRLEHARAAVLQMLHETGEMDSAAPVSSRGGHVHELSAAAAHADDLTSAHERLDGSDARANEPRFLPF